jgi:hypothetical protein
MKLIGKQTFLLFTVVLLSVSAATLSHAGVNWNVNVDIGIPAAQVPTPPPPPQVVLPPQPPQFVYVPELGYYVAAGVPYDLVYVNRRYYHLRDGHWYQADRYGAPWAYTPVDRLPPLMRRHSYVEYRKQREAELTRYQHDKDYRGDYHRPEWKGEHREEHISEHGDEHRDH